MGIFRTKIKKRSFHQAASNVFKCERKETIGIVAVWRGKKGEESTRNVYRRERINFLEVEVPDDTSGQGMLLVVCVTMPFVYETFNLF